MFLEVNRPVTVNEMAHLNAEFKRLLPELKVVILQHGVTLAAHHTEENPS